MFIVKYLFSVWQKLLFFLLLFLLFITNILQVNFFIHHKHQRAKIIHPVIGANIKKYGSAKFHISRKLDEPDKWTEGSQTLRYFWTHFLKPLVPKLKKYKMFWIRCNQSGTNISFLDYFGADKYDNYDQVDSDTKKRFKDIYIDDMKFESNKGSCLRGLVFYEKVIKKLLPSLNKYGFQILPALSRAVAATKLIKYFKWHYPHDLTKEGWDISFLFPKEGEKQEDTEKRIYEKQKEATAITGLTTEKNAIIEDLGLSFFDLSTIEKYKSELTSLIQTMSLITNFNALNKYGVDEIVGINFSVLLKKNPSSFQWKDLKDDDKKVLIRLSKIDNLKTKLETKLITFVWENIKKLSLILKNIGLSKIEGVDFSLLLDKSFANKLHKNLPDDVEKILVKLSKIDNLKSRLNTSIKTTQMKQKMILTNFKTKNSILNTLKSLNKDELKIDDEVFSFKELLKIDWKAKDFDVNKLSSKARIELNKLYVLVNEKDQVKKIENSLNKLKISTKNNTGLSIGTKIGIGVGTSLGVLFLFGGLGYYLYSSKQIKQKSKIKQKT